MIAECDRNPGCRRLQAAVQQCLDAGETAADQGDRRLDSHRPLRAATIHLLDFHDDEMSMRFFLTIGLLSLFCTGCAVVAVADAALTVVATTVKVGAKVVETTVDVAAAGVKAVAGTSEEKNKE